MLAILGTVAVSCQKEAEPVHSSVCSQSEYNVRYTIDNRIYHASLQTSEEWHTFLSDMFALARQGHRIRIQKTPTSHQSVPTKEVITFKTLNPEEANAWAEEMLLAGYDINIEFDSESGYYIVTAIRE